MTTIKNITGMKLLRSLLVTTITTIMVWLPVETFLLFKEARYVSQFVEEDTLVFIMRVRSALNALGNLDVEETDGYRDLFNLYLATSNDKITLAEKVKGVEVKRGEATNDGVASNNQGLVRKFIIHTLCANELRFLNKEPVTTDIAVEATKDEKSGSYRYKMYTTFKNNDRVYTLTIQRNMEDIYSRFMNLEIGALGEMFWCVAITGTLASSILLLWHARRFRALIVSQTQTVAIAQGSALNLARGEGPQAEEACEAVISLGVRLDQANENSINALQDVSHSVASHLTEIKQATDLIRYYGCKDSAEVENQMKRIEANSNRIREIHSTFSSLAKLERSRGGVAPQTFEVQDLLNLAVDFAKTYYPSFQIENPKGGKTKKILIQREHFLLIVEALIQNAVKYSTGDEKRIVIQSLDGDSPIGTARILITNWGIGVPKGEEHRIFERYYRGSNTAHTKGGVGLGLHLVYMLVKMYDGDISVESELIHNHTYKTTFSITFHEYKEET